MDMKNKRSGRGAEFYVNGATGSDTLDAGRGESASKPFKTIQECLNYVSSNYNLGFYNVDINVSAGTYSRIDVVGYQASTGTISIIGDSEDRSSVIIRHVQCDKAVQIYFKHLTIKPLNSATSHSAVSATTGSVYLLNVCIDLSEAFTDNSGSRYGLYASGGVIRIYGSNADNQGLYIKSGDNTIQAVLFVTAAGNLIMTNNIIIQSNITTNSFLSVQNLGVFNRYKPTSPYPTEDPIITLEQDCVVTGKRYRVALNGVVSIANGGTEFFPGSSAGVAESGGQYN